MTIDEYAAWAETIGGPAASRDRTKRLTYLGLGLAGETGEAADVIKKMVRDGRWDRAALLDELGDVAYYWARLCAAAGAKPSAALNRSLQKIERKVARGRRRRRAGASRRSVSHA